VRPRIALVALAVSVFGAPGISAVPARAEVAARVVASRAARAPSPGAQLWTSRYKGLAGNGGRAVQVAASPDTSKVFVTGTSSGGPATDDDYVTVAYNASTGAELWHRRYNGPANNYDTAVGLAVSGDGSTVFVTGISDDASSSVAYATVAYDASNGATLWTRRLDGPYAAGIAVSGDGSKVVVTGTIYGTATKDDYLTVAYNAATGRTLWTTRYNSAANCSESATPSRRAPTEQRSSSPDPAVDGRPLATSRSRTTRRRAPSCGRTASRTRPRATAINRLPSR
jgi:outer membrane protein assembly factor BamB